jgi:hypothetical protein
MEGSAYRNLFFEDQEAKLVEALDRYIIIMREGGEDIYGNQIHSWSAGSASAYALFKKVMELDTTEPNRTIQNELELAVFEYAVGKNLFSWKYPKVVGPIWRCFNFRFTVKIERGC